MLRRSHSPELYRLASTGRGDHGPRHGDLFNVRVAGAKVVLVMGHTSCGAIKGATDNAALGHLTTLLAKIRPAVQATAFDGAGACSALGESREDSEAGWGDFSD